MSGYFKEVNIKYDLPTSNEAIKRITYNIRNGKAAGVAVIKIIHGYGSSGKGGKIRSEARRYLDGQKRLGYIKDYICGEDFSIFHEASRRVLDLCPELRSDRDLDAHNNGMTLVIL